MSKTYQYPANTISFTGSGLATAANQVIMISELQDINIELALQSGTLSAIEIGINDINSELNAQTALLTTIELNQDAQTTELIAINAELDGQTTLLTNIDTNVTDSLIELEAINLELQDQTVLLTSVESELQDINTELDSQTALLTTIEANQDSQTALLTTIEANQDSQTALLTTIDSELDSQTTLLTTLSTNTSRLDVVDFFDTPLLQTSLTNIPGASTTPVTVVASLAAEIFAIHVQDTTGFTVGLYSDPAGTPVLQAILNPGSDSIIPLKLPAATVLGLRNLESNDAITVGTYAINFLG